MSFTIDWAAFAHEEGFQSQIRDMLTLALNKNPPSILEDKVEVLDLNWGSEAPNLEMLELGDVGKDRFRGVFKLTYGGEASITLATKVQANLLHGYAASSAAVQFVLPRTVAAADSLPIPLHLTLRNIRLQGTVIVAFSSSAGLTLVFRNDPLHSVEVTSSLDLVPGISAFLQQQITGHLRRLFREEVPSALYKLSLRYLSRAPPPLPPHVSLHPDTPLHHNSIETDRPASLVNILQLESLFTANQTLALPTTHIKYALMRPQLAALLPTRPRLSLGDPELYAAGPRTTRSRKTPKRRVINLRKKREFLVPCEPVTVPQVTPVVDVHLDSDENENDTDNSEQTNSAYLSLDSDSVESTEIECDSEKPFINARRPLVT